MGFEVYLVNISKAVPAQVGLIQTAGKLQFKPFSFACPQCLLDCVDLV